MISVRSLLLQDETQRMCGRSAVFRPRVLWWAVEFFRSIMLHFLALRRGCTTAPLVTKQVATKASALWQVVHYMADKVEREGLMQIFSKEDALTMVNDPEGTITRSYPHLDSTA